MTLKSQILYQFRARRYSRFLTVANKPFPAHAHLTSISRSEDLPPAIVLLVLETIPTQAHMKPEHPTLRCQSRTLRPSLQVLVAICKTLETLLQLSQRHYPHYLVVAVQAFYDGSLRWIAHLDSLISPAGIPIDHMPVILRQHESGLIRTNITSGGRLLP